MGIFYSVRKSGESVTHPKVRVPNFRSQHMAKLIRGCLLRFSRGTDDQELVLDEGDVYFIGDGYKHGLQAQLMASFRCDGKNVEKHLWLNFHEFAENDLRARKSHKAIGGCHQIEFQYCVTAAPPNVENRTRLNFKDSTTWFDKLGPLTLPPYDKVWRLSFKTKKSMLGTSRGLAAQRLSPFMVLCALLPLIAPPQNLTPPSYSSS